MSLITLEEIKKTCFKCLRVWAKNWLRFESVEKVLNLHLKIYWEIDFKSVFLLLFSVIFIHRLTFLQTPHQFFLAINARLDMQRLARERKIAMVIPVEGITREISCKTKKVL